MDLLKEIKTVQEASECLFSAKDLEHTISSMADSLQSLLQDKNPICITMLNGALPFSASLLKYFNFPLQLDYIHLTRYHGDLEGSKIVQIAKPQLPLKGRCVVLMDDILDYGISLKAAKDFCLSEGAAEVITVVLLKKQLAPEVQIMQADYYGLHCPDRYVFGFGMDYKNYLRNLDGVYALP